MGATRQPPLGPLLHTNTPQSTQKRTKNRKNKSLWSDEALQEAMKAIDAEYTYAEVSTSYGIPRTSLRDHYSSSRTSREIEGNEC